MTGGPTDERISEDQMLFLVELCFAEPGSNPWTADLDRHPFKHQDFWVPVEEPAR